MAPSIAPGNPSVGVMLPYTPLHLLLFTYDDDLSVPDALVMTSANESGAPICHNDEEARQELSGLCDLVLSHNRLIRLRADDSVMDWYDGKPYMIRRSRGYAPLPFFYGRGSGKDVLAMGGELKNCFCIGRNNLFYPSPYIGDMADIRTVEALRGVSFSLEAGELLGFIGPNGAGKSTTIKILSGILRPDSGRVEVGGLVPYAERIAHVSRIGVVFGQRTQLWWDLPVIDGFDLLRDIYRVDPARSRETGGSGLGLAITKHCVQENGGRISVWSRTGEGSTFTIELPAAPDEDDDEARSDESTQA